jgi:hypothetical protein
MKNMSIVPLKGLGPEEQAVQERSIALLKSDSERLIAEYRSRFGIVVGTDLARELFPEYCVNIDSRLRFAASVQRPSALLADLVFGRIVSEIDGGSSLFTAGGTGAGKTTSILRDGTTKEVFNCSRVIFDGNLNSFKPARAKIEAVLERRCKVVVVFVHRHPVEAYINGVIPRALEHGRTVPIQGHLRMHKDSIETFLKCHRHFADNQNVSFIVLNNTGHEQETFKSPVDYLKDIKYDSPVLEAAIRKGLDNELTEKRISQALYEASCGTPRS